MLYRFTTTCRRHVLNLFAELRDVLPRCPRQPPERLVELLPDRWAAVRPTEPFLKLAPPRPVPRATSWPHAGPCRLALLVRAWRVVHRRDALELGEAR
jgi:hypothetical protein